MLCNGGGAGVASLDGGYGRLLERRRTRPE